MKRMMMCLALVMAFAAVSDAQTKTMTGTVVDYSQGNKGNWEGITVKIGDKTYFVYLNTVDYPAAKTVGTVNQAGRMVRVFYTRNISRAGRYAGDVIAAKVVEIRKPRSGKK